MNNKDISETLKRLAEQRDTWGNTEEWADQAQATLQKLADDMQEANTKVGSWVSDGRGHGVHNRSYFLGREHGWEDAINHVEVILGPDMKRAAHLDNPYENGEPKLRQ